MHAKVSFRLWPSLLFLVGVGVSLLLLAAFFTYPQKIHGVGLLLLKGDLKQVLSPVSGTVESWLIEEGDSIKVGDTVAITRDHDHEEKAREVKPTVSGVLAEIIAYPNTVVVKGQAMAIVTNHGDPRRDLELVGFVSSLEGKKIKPGMKALVDPSMSDPYVHGHVLAKVKRVGKLPMTKAAVQSVIKIPEVASYIRGKIDAEPFVVVLTLEENEAHPTGYLWSGPGTDFELDSGVIADIDIIYDEPTILTLLWPSIFHWRYGVK